ncbi:MAG: two-component sensor histidine kinase [Planctomycetaceae bacterium]|nr:two-component sensor histidine kinase [Planctomycetaceae bacterium]
MWSWFFLGFACALLFALPLIISASRRTERRVRRLERRARTAERLAELGTLTGGLAHEIKNPLSTIGLNLQLLRESIDEAQLPEPNAGRLRRRLDAVADETERLRGILEDFLSFAGRMNLDRQPVSPNDVIEELIDFYAPQAEASGVQIRPQLDRRVGPISLDRTLFKQALLNLLINATQAMVEARYGDRPHGGATDLMVVTEPAPDEVRVHVIDTGPGIDPADAKRMFHPYFTTKKAGTGIGLATARRIVNEHGGTLTVHSDPGRGSDFTLTLPLDPPHEDASVAD